MIKRLGAEFIGTFWLVLGGCGSAVLAANFGGDIIRDHDEMAATAGWFHGGRELRHG